MIVRYVKTLYRKYLLKIWDNRATAENIQQVRSYSLKLPKTGS